jgi:hypothetical protein
MIFKNQEHWYSCAKHTFRSMTGLIYVDKQSEAETTHC